MDKDLKERVSKNKLLVAVNKRNNKVVGYIAFRRRYWNINYFIEEIAVEPENQRKGIGSMLVKELEKICSKDNARLFSSTDSENEKSINSMKRITSLDVASLKICSKKVKLK